MSRGRSGPRRPPPVDPMMAAFAFAHETTRVTGGDLVAMCRTAVAFMPHADIVQLRDFAAAAYVAAVEVVGE